MMRQTLLVAAREYRQIVATKGFIIGALSLPLIMALMIGISILAEPPDRADAFLVFDPSGRYAAAIEEAVVLDEARNEMRLLARDVIDRELVVPDSSPWPGQLRSYSDEEARAFIAAGGLKAARQALKLPPAPMEEEARFVPATPPSGLPPTASPQAFQVIAAPALKDKIDTPLGPRRLALALYVPPDYGSGTAPAQMWTSGRAPPELTTLVERSLARALQVQALERRGLPADDARAVVQARAPLLITAPAKADRERLILRSALPGVMAYLLLVTTMITGSMLLQGVMEERSNKLIESLLACITPDELMRGKLIGIGAIGLTLVGAWIGFALLAGFAAPGDFASTVRQAFATLGSPMIVAGAIFYYFTGYIVLGMLFLAVGAFANTTQEAQTYLTPLMLVMVVPLMIIMPAAATGAESGAARVLSWIPIYTPMAMMARLPGGVPLWEFLATGALLLAFMAIEFILIGRIFRATVLSAGQPGKLLGMIRR